MPKKSISIYYIVTLIVLHLPFSCLSADYKNRDCNDLYDPLEPVNRKVFIFNGVVDHVTLRPIAKGYQKIVPKAAKTKINNFVDNLYTPVTFINNILQLDFKSAMKSFWKFSFNSTFGFLGFNNLTQKAGLEVKKQSFGSTLAYYGARPGPYIVIPLYGGTNMRDMLDVITFDKALNPVYHNISNKAYTAISVVSLIHKRALILPITDQIAKTSADPYVAIRSMLHQKRESELNYPEGYTCAANIE